MKAHWKFLLVAFTKVKWEEVKFILLIGPIKK